MCVEAEELRGGTYCTPWQWAMWHCWVMRHAWRLLQKTNYKRQDRIQWTALTTKWLPTCRVKKSCQHSCSGEHILSWKSEQRGNKSSGSQGDCNNGSVHLACWYIFKFPFTYERSNHRLQQLIILPWVPMYLLSFDSRVDDGNCPDIFIPCIVMSPTLLHMQHIHVGEGSGVSCGPRTAVRWREKSYDSSAQSHHPNCQLTQHHLSVRDSQSNTHNAMGGQITLLLRHFTAHASKRWL